MTIMTVFELGPNIVLNRVFQCEKQFCLDLCTVLNWIGGVHYFLGFRTSCFTSGLSMVKNVVFRLLSMFFMFFVFRRTLFVHSLCRFVCLVGVEGWGSGASFWVIVCVVRLADCGSSLGTFMSCIVVNVVCRGLSDLFVLFLPSPVFLKLLLRFLADWFVGYWVALWGVLWPAVVDRVGLW